MAVPPRRNGRPLEVLIIGAGQAGLALAWYLQAAGASFLVVDAGPRVGHAWRSRWDSLRLFTPAEYASLPGLPFPASAGTYPSKDLVADYLEEYAEIFGLPVRANTRVTRLTSSPDGLHLETTTGPLTARHVVVATGAFSSPYVPPDLAAGLCKQVVQVHSSDYKRAGDLPDGQILVVGAGNSGVQIAVELASARRPVSLAVGRRLRMVPQRPFGRDVFWWLTTLGLVHRPRDTGSARRPRVWAAAAGSLIEAVWRRRGTVGSVLSSRQATGSDASIGFVIGTTWRRVRASGVSLRPRAVTASGSTIGFSDGTTLDVAAVVWATGFRMDYSWLDVPGIVVDGQVVHTNGLTAVPGLTFLGLPRQRSRSSDWLGFVADDAAWLADRLLAEGRRVADAPSEVVPVQ